MLRKYKSLYSSTTNTFSTGEAVTITPASVVGLPTDTEITLTFDRVDGSGTKTPSKMERIRGTVVGSNFVVSSGGRAVEGTEQTHTSPVVEMIWNADDWNDTVDHILTEHNQDGTHKDTLVTSLKATGAEINTGTEDAKIVTPKAIADSYLGGATSNIQTQINARAGADGWTSANETWAYASASTITVPSGAASKYSVGDRIKLTANSVVLYAYIRIVADTLLTVSGNTLTNHTFTANYYSHQDSPLGFPSMFDYTPTLIADSTNPTLGSSTIAGRFWVTGKVCNVEIKLMINTSGWNAGSGIYRFSLPMTCSVNGVSHPGVSLLIDNGSSVTICCNEIWSSGTTVNLSMLPGFLNLTNSALTWANGDGIFVNCQYKIA